MESSFEETWFHAPVHALGNRTLLPEDEARHFLKVLRLRPGCRVTTTDGLGHAFLCETKSLGDKVELLAVEELPARPRPSLHMVLGLLKGRDLEEPVEGLCQLDLAAVHLVLTDHTQVFKGQDHARLLERLELKSEAALKQAKKAWLTRIHAPRPLREWRRDNPGDLILVHPGPDRLPTPSGKPCHVLVGPEGGFSPAELKWLKSEESAFSVGLGATRIRGTHAPLLACGS